MPTEAEDDCMTAVNTAPASRPSMGLENSKSILVNSGTFASGLTAADMVSMPNIRTAKPSSTSPVSLRLGCFINRYITMPTTPSTGVNVAGLKSARTPEP